MENDKLMGNIWDINIDINKDTFIKNKELIKYCIYDVVYLPQLFNKFKKVLPDNIIDIIIELGCKSFIIRYGVIFEFKILLNVKFVKTN
jgi:hypothetical protein